MWLLTDSLQLLQPSQQIQTDAMGNIFSLNKNFQLEKYNKKNNLIKTYRPPLGYRISSFDASVPFRVLLFSDELQTISILDSDLKPFANRVLNTLKVEYITHVALSNDNSCWLFSAPGRTLYKLNPNGKIIAEVPIQSKEISQIKAWQSSLLLLSGEGIVYVTDAFGRIKNEKKTDSCWQVAPLNNEKVLLFQKNNRIQICQDFEKGVADCTQWQTTSDFCGYLAEKNTFLSLNKTKTKLFFFKRKTDR